MSPEGKKRQDYKYFNNTIIYVAFREVSIREPQAEDTKIGEEFKSKVRLLYNAKIKPDLEEIGLQGFKLKKVFENHVQVQLASLDDIKPAAKKLKYNQHVLAVEFLDQKNVFGMKASVEEMAKFKSNVKKQKVVYDPAGELEKGQKREA